MSLDWRDPPPERRVFNEITLAELRAEPGRWALIRTWRRKGGKANKIKPPPGDIECCYRYPRGTTELYARAKP